MTDVEAVTLTNYNVVFQRLQLYGKCVQFVHNVRPLVKQV